MRRQQFRPWFILGDWVLLNDGKRSNAGMRSRAFFYNDDAVVVDDGVVVDMMDAPVEVCAVRNYRRAISALVGEAGVTFLSCALAVTSIC